MGGVPSVDSAVWRCRKVRVRGKGRKSLPTLLPQLQAILFDPQRQMSLKLELAVTIDVGEHFVKATYFLEGYGPLVLACYEKLSAVSQFCQAPHFPNVRTVATAMNYWY